MTPGTVAPTGQPHPFEDPLQTANNIDRAASPWRRPAGRRLPNPLHAVQEPADTNQPHQGEPMGAGRRPPIYQTNTPAPARKSEPTRLPFPSLFPDPPSVL